LTLIHRVVSLIARCINVVLSTTAFDFDLSFTKHTGIAVACFHALMSSTGQKFLTIGSAGRDWFCAFLTLPSDKLLNRVMTTWTEKYSLGVFLARIASSLVAQLFTFVVNTVKLVVADILTKEFVCAAN
jgi:hypothetical protein